MRVLNKGTGSIWITDLRVQQRGLSETLESPTKKLCCKGRYVGFEIFWVLI